MINPLVCVISIAAMGAYSATVQAESFRCGDQVVTVGDDKARVLRYCGKPVVKERPLTKTGWSHDERGKRHRQHMRVENWVYDAPEGRMTRRLVFVDGKIADIEVGDRR